LACAINLITAVRTTTKVRIALDRMARYLVRIPYMHSTSRAKARMWLECVIWQGSPGYNLIQPWNFARLQQMTLAVLAERRTSLNTG
jgi:hypothetical protein